MPMRYVCDRCEKLTIPTQQRKDGSMFCLTCEKELRDHERELEAIESARESGHLPKPDPTWTNNKPKCTTRVCDDHNELQIEVEKHLTGGYALVWICTHKEKDEYGSKTVRYTCIFLLKGTV